MLNLPDNIKKALELIAYLSYNKGKSDQKRGNEGPEKFEDFVKQRIKDAERLL